MDCIVISFKNRKKDELSAKKGEIIALMDANVK